MKKYWMVAGALALAATQNAAADFSGFYMGLGAGALQLKEQAKYPTFGYSDDVLTETLDNTSNGTGIGANFSIYTGYAWTFDESYFLGLELFYNYNTATASSSNTLQEDVVINNDVKLNNPYGFRFLPGFYITPNTVLFGIAGLTAATVDVNVSDNYNDLIGDNVSLNNAFTLGYQFGLGAMTELSDHLALRTDVIYTDYNSVGYDAGLLGDLYEVDPSSLEMNVSLLYKFG